MIDPEGTFSATQMQVTSDTTAAQKDLSLCEKHNISGYKLCNEIGISKSTLTDLKMGRKKSLNAATAAKIADYFGVSVSYLLGDNNEKKKPITSKNDGLGSVERHIIELLHSLTPENQKIALAQLDAMLKIQKNEQK